MASVMLAAACSTQSEFTKYEAEYSAWKLALKRTHTWREAEEPRYESLELIVDPSKRDKDLPIDGQQVIAEYEHGGADRCIRAHSVEGTFRLVELGADYVRTKIDARLICPGGEKRPLKGDMTFDVKTPR